MAYRWLVFVAGAILLAILAWYFGRPVVPVQHASSESVGVAAATPAAEAPKATSPKVVEVIDLARAYDPVREVETTSPGEINPASFVEEQYAPARIPYAADDENSPQVCGCFLAFPRYERIVVPPRIVNDLAVLPVRLNVMPREVATIQNGLIDFVPLAADAINLGELRFTPMGVPFQPGPSQPIPPNARIENGLLNFTPSFAGTNEPVRLNVMPREVK